MRNAGTIQNDMLARQAFDTTKAMRVVSPESLEREARGDHSVMLHPVDVIARRGAHERSDAEGSDVLHIASAQDCSAFSSRTARNDGDAKCHSLSA
ncbi:hypothetical protein RX327_07355 [Bradyrhizobium sp. BEA-2-5]|uniref:hypothetical protein n=1 Tax=Bradyrhizobium TaxID=374 RepID=UPI000A78F952|nr:MULTISPECIES: hypothetical protein [Bradyrhizobium]WOH82962.1 hypothetical protein RX327_07355 [Bradyrhizobium sp. BEA-2-5]